MQADPLLCRLDRVLVTPQFESKFPLLTHTVLSRTLSDHSDIKLLVQSSRVLKKLEVMVGYIDFFRISKFCHVKKITKVKILLKEMEMGNLWASGDQKTTSNISN